MDGRLYIIAAILLVVWAIGFFAFHIGGLFNLVLVAAVIVLLIRLVEGNQRE